MVLAVQTLYSIMNNDTHFLSRIEIVLLLSILKWIAGVFSYLGVKLQHNLGRVHHDSGGSSSLGKRNFAAVKLSCTKVSTLNNVVYCIRI